LMLKSAWTKVGSRGVRIGSGWALVGRWSELTRNIWREAYGTLKVVRCRRLRPHANGGTSGRPESETDSEGPGQQTKHWETEKRYSQITLVYWFWTATVWLVG
jgi:hypothetical protein